MSDENEDIFAKEASEMAKNASKSGHKILVAAAVILIAVVVVNISIGMTFFSTFDQKEKEAEEAVRPAKIDVTVIRFDNCDDCFDINQVLQDLKSKSVLNIASERTLSFSDSQSKDLIAKYSIDKLPTLIVTGEINKSNAASVITGLGSTIKDAVVYAHQTPPYFDVEQNKVVGLVTATLITDGSCKDCFDASSIPNQVISLGPKIVSTKIYDYKSAESQALIKKYNITKVPTVLFSPEIDIYGIESVWLQVGTIENDQTYVFREVVPYRDVNSSQIRGLVDVIFLKDSSCTSCYDVNVHKAILSQSLGMTIRNETSYDINSTEAKSLLSKYNITKVPTELVSPEAKEYASFLRVWPQVGTAENDSWYVFRSTQLMGTYKDLSTNQTISPQTQTTGG